MDYRGPETADFANVASLNRAFLLLLRNTATGRRTRQQLPVAIQELIRGLTDLHIGRLSLAPFLLLSLHERDDGYWAALVDDDKNSDLLAAPPGNADAVQLGVTGVAFLWHLARHNPYAARFVCGASLGWCEQLADCALQHLLQKTTRCLDLLQPRLADNIHFWNKLLGPGLSSEPDVRAAAHMAAFQTILAANPAAKYRPLRAAACSSIAPTLQVADKRPL